MGKLLSQEYALVAIDKVKPHPDNPRRGDLDAISKSIDANGFYGAIAVQKSSGRILAGNHRWESAKAKGLKKIPVIWLDVDDEAALRILLADNRTSDLGTYADEALAAILMELRSADKLLGTGYAEVDVGKLLKDIGDEIIAAESAAAKTIPAPADAPPAEEAVPEIPVVPFCRPGDKWILGRHRLVCGDATNAKDIARLMEGKKAQLVFTDPPYNVAYERYTEQQLTIEGDRLTYAQFKDFLNATFASYAAATLETASLYVCHPSSFQREFQNAMETAGFEVRTQIIWAKNRFAWGFARYKFAHEPIFYAHRAAESDAWYGDKSQSTLWQENKPSSANRPHPTMKPVELIYRALANSSRNGDLVLDLFGGSGSTLVACESMKRECRTMEIDPRYCDVIIRRWQQATGELATREDGVSFGASPGIAA